MPDDTLDSETPGADGAPDDRSLEPTGDSPAPQPPPRPAPMRLVALRRADRWVLGEAARPEPGQPFEVHLADGTTQSFARPPITLAWVQPGSLLHQAAQDPQEVQRRFLTEPGDVVAQLLRDLGRPQVKADLIQRVADLHLKAPGDWWPAVSKALKAHPNVRVEGGKYSWSDSPVHAAAAPPRAARPSPVRPAPVRTSPVRPSPVRTSPVRPAPPETGDETTAAPPDSGPAGTPGDPGDPGAPGTVAAAAAAPAAPVSRQAAESSRQTQARLAVLRALRHLAQGSGDDDALLREVESAAGELPHGSPEAELADLLSTALLDPAAFDAAPLPSRGLESSTRYDLARLAVRLRAHAAAVRSLLALERLDSERLLVQLPWDDPGFAAALAEHVTAQSALDGRTAQRLESAVRQLALTLGAAPEPVATVQAGAVTLLAALSAHAGLAAHPGLVLLGRSALLECLRPGLDADAVGDQPAPVLVGLVTGPLAGPLGLPAPAFTTVLLALDTADRLDVLTDPALWAGVDVLAAAADPDVADVLVGRELVDPVVAPAVQRELASGDARRAVRLFTLPDDLLGTLPEPDLVAALESAVGADSPQGSLLRSLAERIAAA